MDCDACVFGLGQLRKEAKTDSIKLTPPAKEGKIDHTFWEKMEKSYVDPTVGVPRHAWCFESSRAFAPASFVVQLVTGMGPAQLASL